MNFMVITIPALISLLRRLRFGIRKSLLGAWFIWLLMSASSVYASANIELSWKGSGLLNKTGYKIYYDTVSSDVLAGKGLVEGDSPIKISNVTTSSVSDLPENTTYYFAVTAYSDALESKAANKIMVSVNDPKTTTIKNINSSNILANSAKIDWTTTKGSTSQVEYGATDSYGAYTTFDPVRPTSHSVEIQNLSAMTTYHYRIRSQDAEGNLFISGDYTFTTTSDLAIKGENLLKLERGVIFTKKFDLTGGAGPYKTLISAGTLPAGVNLDTEGELSGVPMVTGIYEFTIQSTDSQGSVGTYSVTMDIADTIAPNPPDPKKKSSVLVP